jgi:hypothetical protein
MNAQLFPQTRIQPGYQSSSTCTIVVFLHPMVLSDIVIVNLSAPAPFAVLSVGAPSRPSAASRFAILPAATPGDLPPWKVVLAAAPSAASALSGALHCCPVADLLSFCSSSSSGRLILFFFLILILHNLINFPLLQFCPAVCVFLLL